MWVRLPSSALSEKMVKTVHITYFVHSTSFYNEKGLLAGWYDVELSELGKKQSVELGKSVKNTNFDAVFSSDLKRALDTAKVAFKGRKILVDKRLRECNYGDLAGTPCFADTPEDIHKIFKYINKPFPNGESYKDTEKRIQSFLKDLLKDYAGKHVAIVGHQAPQLALEVLLNGETWKRAFIEDWRLKTPKEWKPGWEYKLKG